MLKRGRAGLMIGVALIILLIAILIPKYRELALHSREEILRVNLTSMRDVIKKFTQDKQRAPQSLQDLIDAGYFQQLPVDPFTDSNSTWEPVIETITLSTGQTIQGITDLRSGSSSVSSKGTSYREW
jgi:general secretion pathway protein G